MNLVKFIIFILGVFIILFLLALILPSKVTVVKSIEINATPNEIKNQITNFDQWKNWYPAFENEGISFVKNPSSKKYISSVTLINKKGKSIQLNLTDTTENIIEIQTETPSSTEVSYQFLLIPKLNHQTQLTWNINVNLGWYPWKRIEGIFFDKFSGDQYKSALENLKKSIEN